MKGYNNLDLPQNNPSLGVGEGKAGGMRGTENHDWPCADIC